MVAKPKPGATYDDIVALPPNMVGQIIDGTLYAHSRPATPHAAAASAIAEELGPPFKRGRGGPGGWMIVFEPELHFGDDVLVPDIAGWRRERMPELPHAPFITLAPDWICEVLSPSTAGLDRVRKMDVYARQRVSWAWLVDPVEKTLEIYELAGDAWKRADAFEGDAKVRARPFDAIELDMSILWAR
jgi:Uma2 family endonuclease